MSKIIRKYTFSDIINIHASRHFKRKILKLREELINKHNIDEIELDKLLMTVFDVAEDSGASNPYC